MSRTSTTPSTASAATDDDVRAVETFLCQFPELGRLKVLISDFGWALTAQS